MKIKIIITILLIMSFLNNISLADIQPLKVSANGRYLVDSDGEPVFLNADTAWKIAWKLNRDEVEKYLQTRKDQKFNTIGIVAFPMDIDNDRAITNVYGDKPLEYKNDKFNPLKPVTTSGENHKNSKEYDYWDHLEYIIDTAESKNMYIILLPAWGGRVAGAYGSGKPNSEIIFDKSKAYKYALWISKKLKDKKNIIWMIGGDRSAVYGKNDYRSVFRAMAKGLISGSGNKEILISYHPQKWAPNSSEWFHNSPWLSFNSIQDQPSDQIKAITHDWNLKPAKPTWLFEGRYEGFTKASVTFKDFQVRFQAYQTVFEGGLGETYGNMAIWNFSKNWKKHIDDPGANQLRYLVKLMSLWSKEQYLSRIPDQSLIIGNAGKISGSLDELSTCIAATRTKKGDLAMIYTAAGNNLLIKMRILNGPMMHAYWYNPRTGKWKVAGKEVEKPTPFSNDIHSGKKAFNYQFYVPKMQKESNDWVLILSNKKL